MTTDDGRSTRRNIVYRPSSRAISFSNALKNCPITRLAPAWSSRDRSAREKEVLGFYFSEHPLEHLRAELERLATHPLAEVLRQEDGTEVRVAGVVLDCRTLTTRNGKLMAVVTLEDLTGRVECTVFPDTYEGARATLAADQIVVAAGRVEVRDDRGVKLLLSEVAPLEEARRRYRPALQLRIGVGDLSVERLEAIDAVLSAHPGEAEVYVYIVHPDRSMHAMRSRRYRVAEDGAVIGALTERCPWLGARWQRGAS